MQMTKGTIQVLKNFNTMNKSVLIEAGNRIRTISTGKSVLVDVDLNDTFPAGGGIYDLSKFLGALSLFPEPSLDFETNVVDIGGTGGRVTYVFSDPSMILTPPETSPKMPSPAVTFDLPKEAFDRMLRGSGVMGLPDLVIRVKDSNTIELEALVQKTGVSSDRFRLEDISAEVSCEPGVEFRFKMGNLHLLPVDYSIRISEAGIAQFVGLNTTDICKSVTYYVATEGNR